MSFQNLFNPDFQDFILAFNKYDVEYMLIGGYLVILNGYNRTTGDLDIWVNPTETNYIKLRKAFKEFGIPENAIPQEQFLNVTEFDVFTFGVSPVSIDILTQVKGLNFLEAWKNSKIYNIEKNLDVRGLTKSDLIKAKKASGRNKDLDDIENIL